MCFEPVEELGGVLRRGMLAQDAKRGGRISAAIYDRRATKSCAKRPAAVPHRFLQRAPSV